MSYQGLIASARNFRTFDVQNAFCVSVVWMHADLPCLQDTKVASAAKGIDSIVDAEQSMHVFICGKVIAKQMWPHSLRPAP